MELKTKEFNSTSDLRCELEKLYLEAHGNFKLEFAESQYKDIEKMFDELVLTHGFKNVFFQYEVSPSIQAPKFLLHYPA